MKYLIGVEVKSATGNQQIFSRLSDLTHSTDVRSLLTCEQLNCKWHNPIWLHDQNPRVSLFLLRKADNCRLCLAADSSEGHIDQDDYAGRCEMECCNRCTVTGTGDGDDAAAKMCTAIRVAIKMTVIDCTLKHLHLQLEVNDYDFDGYVVDTIEELLQTIEAPAFAARWVPPPQRIRLRKQVAEVSSELSQHENVCQRLQRTVVAAPNLTSWRGHNAPSLLSVCLLHLSDVRDLVRAGEVCKGWHRASKHDTAWGPGQVLENCSPTLMLLRGRRTCLHTCEQLCAQQRDANQAALVPLSPRTCKRTDYMVAVQIAISAQEPLHFLCDLETDGQVNLLTRNVRITGVSFDNLSVKLSLLRKRDSKCFHMVTYDDEWTRDADYMYANDCVSTGLSGDCSTIACIEARFTIVDHSHVSEREIRTDTITSIKFHVEDIEATDSDCPCIANVDALLQMVEWPDNAHRWK